MIDTSSPELRFVWILAACLSAVEQLVEPGQRPRVVRPADHVPGEPELRQQIRLDRQAPLRRGAADVGQRVERIDPLEHDRLHLEDRVAGVLAWCSMP